MTKDTTDELAQMNENDFVQILRAVGVFLRDVEASLNSMEFYEAEEVADVELTVGRLFVASLQSAHDQLAPEDLVALTTAEPTSSTNRSTVTIERLDEEEENEKEKKRLVGVSLEVISPSNKKYEVEITFTELENMKPLTNGLCKGFVKQHSMTYLCTLMRVWSIADAEYSFNTSHKEI